MSSNLTIWPLSTISSRMNETSRSSMLGILSFLLRGILVAGFGSVGAGWLILALLTWFVS